MWELRTGCRLHFGLMELSPGAPNRYAGLGVMLQRPSMIVRVTNALQSQRHVTADCLDSDSLAEYQNRIESWQQQSTIAATIELLSGFPFHCGLGSGTQLACLLATAGKLVTQLGNGGAVYSNQWQSVRQVLGGLDPAELARLSGRGLRSAIGLQGFLTAGLILDSGYQSAGSEGRAVQTTVSHLPADWCFVLIRGSSNSSITGAIESQLIRSMAAQLNPHRQQMLQLAHQALEFAASSSFGRFCEVLEEYMRFAGDMFAPVQGGRYNGAVCSQAVELARQLGLRAVGQSSWGPTIFGLAENIDRAQEVADSIHQQASSWHVQIAQPAQEGAEVRFANDH